jgi:hypothetical protein
MRDAKTYREYAADCRRMAKLLNPNDKTALLKMAEAWEGRAREAERRETDRMAVRQWGRNRQENGPSAGG